MKSSHITKKKPSYDQSLCAYQTAFKVEFTRIIASLPFTKESRILDVPCGNGFYARILADCLGPNGGIDCVDLNAEYLATTRRRLQKVNCQKTLHEADAYNLPFADSTFDLVWCAQSLISLDDALTAVQEMKRVLRPGGVLAVLENDFFHQVLLPWPVDLEVPILKAVQTASRASYGSSTKLAPVRRLPKIFAGAGFHSCGKQTLAADRQAPWPASVQRFLEFHVADLRGFLRGHLPAKVRTAFRRFVDPQRSDSLFGDRAMDLTCLNVLYQAKKRGRMHSDP
jgi:ubiquinone/menaquinone biosynthesis C-methylase UbiE